MRVMSLVGLMCGVCGNSCVCSLSFVVCSDNVSVGLIGFCGRCLNMCWFLIVENMRFFCVRLFCVLSSVRVLRMLLRLCVGLFMFMSMMCCIGCCVCVSVICVMILLFVRWCMRLLWFVM